MLKKKLYIIFLLPTLAFAQRNLPLNREWGLEKDKYFSIIHEKKDSLIPQTTEKSEPVSCFKPYIFPSSHIAKDKSRSWGYRKLKKENLISINDTADKFYLTVDPIFNFQVGKDLTDKNEGKLYVNTRGFMIRGDIGRKFSFESSFYENQSTFSKYIDDYMEKENNLFPQTASFRYNVTPGQGRAKDFETYKVLRGIGFKKNGYDYSMASGYVSYSPNKIFNIQVGNGKHFVGDGYRSLLLSDNGFNYPYARITTTYKNIQYTNLYTSFMNLTSGGVQTPPNTERLFQKKIGSFQMLSFNFFHRLQIGLFQGMIWEASDSTNRQHANFNTFDPVIGVNAIGYGLHNTNNVLLGGTLKLKITNLISLYGQYMLDDLSSKDHPGDLRNKYGYQLGFKYFDLFTVKNLHIQLEYNSVRPYAYAAEDPEQSYTHYNQALGHPLGANFRELIGFINYRIKDFFIELKGNYAVKGADTLTNNFGGNIFKQDNLFPVMQDISTAKTTQGLKTTIIYQDVHIGYLVNPATNFNIVIGLSNRTEKTNKSTTNTQFIYIGIRTSLSNLYYDF